MQQQKIQECFEIADLKQLINKSNSQRLVIIDVRSQEEFTENHIPGAINIPLNELESRATGLSKQAIIITACGKGGGRSAQAAELLKQMGFINASFLCGGTFGWYEWQAI